MGVRVLVFELWIETFHSEVSENGPEINLDQERNQGKSGLNRTQLFFEQITFFQILSEYEDCHEEYFYTKKNIGSCASFSEK